MLSCWQRVHQVSPLWFGNLAATTEFPLQSVVTRQISLFGSCACGEEYPNAVDIRAFWATTLPEIEALPGVVAAGVADAYGVKHAVSSSFGLKSPPDS